MKPLGENEIDTFPHLFFSDVETRQDETREMIPFYAVVLKVCKYCDQYEFKTVDAMDIPKYTIPTYADPKIERDMYG